jgi:hypothetical protein
MAIAFRNATNAGNASGGDLTIDKPAGVVDNDILVVALYREASSGWTLPDGWAQIREEAVGTTMWLTLAWKRASSEGANYVFQIATTFRAGVMAAFSGCSTGVDIIDAQDGQSNSGGNPVALSVTTGTNGNMEIVAVGNYDGNTITYSSGTSVALAQHLGCVDIFYAEKTTAGAVGTTTFNPSAGYWATITSALEILGAAATLTQVTTRARNDDGSESAATTIADGNFTAPLATNVRVRFQIDTSGDAAATQYQLEAQRQGDQVWTKV